MLFGISVALVVVGAAFVVIASLGVVRMPDLFTRMSATSKAATLGVGLMLSATAVHFNDIAVTSRVVATIVFLLLTSPVAAHVIARAAYSTGTPLWSGTVVDELREVYDARAERGEVLQPEQTAPPSPAAPSG